MKVKVQLQFVGKTTRVVMDALLERFSSIEVKKLFETRDGIDLHSYEFSLDDGGKYKLRKNATLNKNGVNPDAACELISPFIDLESGFEMDTFADVVDALKAAGVTVTNECGCHIHIDCGSITKTRARILSYMKSQSDLLEEFKPHDERMLREAVVYDVPFVEAFAEERMYFTSNGQMLRFCNTRVGRDADIDSVTNPMAKYGLNIHSLVTNGTLEFQLFNGTLDMADIHLYITAVEKICENASKYM